MRVLVTRPEREARAWLAGLAAGGHEALALPLIAIAPVPDPRALRQAWHKLLQGSPSLRAVMFVSGNAVSGFFAEKPLVAPVFRGDSAIKTRAWATGPGTARALLEAGVEASCIDVPARQSGQFDSEALWALVQRQVHAGDQVLIVRGTTHVADTTEASSEEGDGRDWLAGQLSGAGARVQSVASYQRALPELGAQGLALARAAAVDGSIWLISSSQALANLQRLLPDQRWDRARALVTHPRIAQAAQAAGFGVVCRSRPVLSEVMASIESMA